MYSETRLFKDHYRPLKFLLYRYTESIPFFKLLLNKLKGAYISYEFATLLFYAIHRVQRKETLLRYSRVPLEIFTSPSLFFFISLPLSLPISFSISLGITLRFLKLYCTRSHYF